MFSCRWPCPLVDRLCTTNNQSLHNTLTLETFLTFETFDQSDEEIWPDQNIPTYLSTFWDNWLALWEDVSGPTNIYLPSYQSVANIFKYLNTLVTNLYSDIRSYQFFFYKYICGHLFVSIFLLQIYSDIRLFFIQIFLDIHLCPNFHECHTLLHTFPHRSTYLPIYIN